MKLVFQMVWGLLAVFAALHYDVMGLRLQYRCSYRAGTRDNKPNHSPVKHNRIFESLAISCRYTFLLVIKPSVRITS